MIDVTAFGLGCFVFEVVPAADQTSFEVGWWRDELLKALGGISSVSSVEVEVDFDQLTDGHWRFDPVQRSAAPDVQSFLPAPTGTTVRFEIVIPSRMHPDLLDSQALETERFRVEIEYGYFGPSTIVTCLDSGFDAEGSLAVRLLWRFLQREFSKHTETLQFTLVGPSPFHANFWLRVGKEDQAAPLEWKVVGRHGYADIVLAFAPSSFHGVDEAFRQASYALREELSLFYGLKLIANYTGAIEHYLAAKTAELMYLHSEKGLKSTTRRLFRSGSAARQLGLEALSLKLHHKSLRTSSLEAIRDVYQESSVLAVIRDAVDGTCPPDDLPAIETALDVVKFAEGSRTKEVEIAVVSASTLLGAAAGAVASVLAGG